MTIANELEHRADTTPAQRRGRLEAGTVEARRVARTSVEARQAKVETAASLPSLALDDASETMVKSLLSDLARGKIQVRHAQDAAALIRVLHDVIRLERGQATSISERVDVVAELRDLLPTLQLRAADVQASDGDPPSSSTV